MAYLTSFGLSPEQYRRNIQVYGLNQIPEALPPSKLSIFLSQFKSSLIYILLLASIITFLLGDYLESVGIMLVVVINSFLGFYQESRAANTLATLKRTLRPQCTVIRSGEEQVVPITSLTVGDVVALRLGDKVPADGVIVSANELGMNEAMLTGESEAVNKTKVQQSVTDKIRANGFLHQNDVKYVQNENKAFMGAAVMSGFGRMLVTSIGDKTEFGKIAESINTEEKEATPLQIRLLALSKTLTIIITGVCIFIFVWGLILEKEIAELLELSIAVAVSAIPEGLVIGLTVILTLGMNRILKRKALMRKLVATETLGSVDVICLDKTGTLTEGKMSVAHTFFTDATIAKRALLATNHSINSVEISLASWLEKNITNREKAEFRQEEYVDHKVFDSLSKFSATLGSENMYVVGAPEVLLENCELSKNDLDHWHEEISKYSSRGWRLIGLSYTKVDGSTALPARKLAGGLSWLGLVVMEDPPRKNLKQVFEKATAAGISTKVITGDYRETAVSVMAQIGIELGEHEVLAGEELEKLSEAELRGRVESTRLFYRTSPLQKLMIVKALQANGHVVAMMGDGINDTPALNKAEIGIVVDNATEFSKDIADMVLLDSNFQTIIAAVEEGRTIFENMRKVTAYLLVGAFNSLIMVVGAIIFNLPTPLLPLQILYINFVTDGIPDLTLAFEKPEKGIMQEKPRPKDYPLIDRDVKLIVLIIGFIVSIIMFSVYVFMLGTPMPIEEIRTLIFVTLSTNTLVYIYAIRSFRKNIFQHNPFANRVLNLGVLLGMISLFIAVYTPFMQSALQTVPLRMDGWAVAFATALVSITLIELIKWWNRRNAKIQLSER